MELDLSWCLCNETKSAPNSTRNLILQPSLNERVSVIDYYAAVGIKAGHYDDLVRHRNDLRSSIASIITDIAFLAPTSKPPPGWAVIVKKVLNGAVMCVKRASDSGRSDYITSLRLALRGSLHGKSVPYVDVAKNLNNGSEHPLRNGNFSEQDVLLVIERAPIVSPERSLADAKFHLAYRPAGINNIYVMSSKQSSGDICFLNENLSKTRLLGNGLYLGFTRSNTQGGVCSTPLAASTLSRFPPADYDDFPLPSRELPLFCFPRGYYLQYCACTDSPATETFSFVLTSSSGGRVHVSCLMEFDELDATDAAKIWNQFAQLNQIELPDTVVSEENGPGIMEKLVTQVESSLDDTAASISGAFTKVRDKLFPLSTAIELEKGVTPESPEYSPTDRQIPIRRRYSWPTLSVPEPSKLNNPGSVRTVNSLTEIDNIFQPNHSKNGHNRDDFRLYAPRCICVISTFPFYRASQNLLWNIHSISRVPSRIPLDLFVKFFVSQIPCPKPGGASIEVLLTDSFAQELPQKNHLLPILLKQPSLCSLPACDISFLGPLETLDVHVILDVFTLMLQEKQIIFVSSGFGGSLAEVMEAFRMLIFPLEWQGLFVNRLPSTLVAQLSDAPGGYLMGMLVSEQDALHLKQLRSKLSISPDVAIISLDKGGSLSTSPEQAAPRRYLPGKLLKQLEERIRLLHHRTRFTTKRNELSHLQTLPPSPSLSSTHGLSVEQVKNIAVNLRDAFLRFMVDLLGSLRTYLSLDGTKFDHHQYLSDSQPHFRTFLGGLIETQMFSVLASNHLSMDYTHDHRMTFYELAVEEAKFGPSSQKKEATLELQIQKRFQKETSLEYLGVVRLALSKSLYDFHRDESKSAVRIDGPVTAEEVPLFKYVSWPTPLMRALRLSEAASPEVKRVQQRFTPAFLNQGLVHSLLRLPHEYPLSIPFVIHKSSVQAISIYALVILSTPALILSSFPAHAINQVLRALGILSSIEAKEQLFLFDESIWRALMVSCAAIGGRTFSEAVKAVYQIRAVARDSSRVRPSTSWSVPTLTFYTFCKMCTVKPDILQSSTDYYSPLDQVKHSLLERSGWEWLKVHCPSVSNDLRLDSSIALQGWLVHHVQAYETVHGMPENISYPGALHFDGPMWSTLPFQSREVDIWMSTACPNCDRPFLDEEVMDLWRKGASCDLDLLIRCPNCKTNFLPSLNYRDRNKWNVNLSVPWVWTEGTTSTSVAYINPMVLRSFFEELLIHGGNDAYDMEWLEQNCPVFFWNAAWWCERLKIPFPWTSQYHLILRLGSKLPTDRPLSLQERFRNINFIEESALTRMLKVLGDSEVDVDGVREAVAILYLLKSDKPSLQVPYQVMYWLVTMIEGDKFEMNGNSSHGKSFDELYTNAVSKVIFRTGIVPVESAIPTSEQQRDIFERLVGNFIPWLKSSRDNLLPDDFVGPEQESEENTRQQVFTVIKDLTQTAPSPGLWRYRMVFGRLRP